MKGFAGNIKPETTKTSKQNLLALAYSILFLISYLVVRGILNCSTLFTISPYLQKPKAFINQE